MKTKKMGTIFKKIRKEWKLTYNPEVDLPITTTKRYLREFPYVKICEQTVIDVSRCIILRLINGFKAQNKTEELKDLLVIIANYVTDDIFDEEKFRKEITKMEVELDEIDRKYNCKQINQQQKKSESFDGGIMYI